MGCWNNGVTWSYKVGYTSDYLSDTYTLTSGISAGLSYKFKIYAKNVWGTSTANSILTVVASGVPNQMSQVTTSIDSSTGGVKIAWTEPYDAESTITSYLIEISDDSGTFHTETTNCDGSDSVNFSRLYCIVPMSVLTDTAGDFDLDLNDLVQVRATASNANGIAALPSAVNTAGAIVDTVPTFMNDPERGSASTKTRFEITWDALTLSDDMGGSTITSYSLEWDSGLGTSAYTVLVGFSSNNLLTSYTVYSGVTAGVDYEFRLRAKNIHGWGPYSNIVTLVASSVPGNMAVPTTTNSANGVDITWVAPDDNESALTGYNIFIKTSTGDYEDSTSCDGSDPNVLTCFMLMSELRAAPYLLEEGDLVAAIVQA